MSKDRLNSIAAALALCFASGLAVAQVRATADVMPPASQLEELGTINRVDVPGSTLWINGRAYRFSAGVAAFLDGKRLVSLSQVKIGQSASFQSRPDGSLTAIVISTESD